MDVIDVDGSTVRVDDDGPSPLPEMAHWLKDVEPPKKEVCLLLRGLGLVASVSCEGLEIAAGVVELVIDLLDYYLSGFRIAPTKYVTATSQAMTFSTASASVHSE